MKFQSPKVFNIMWNRSANSPHKAHRHLSWKTRRVKRLASKARRRYNRRICRQELINYEKDMELNEYVDWKNKSIFR